MKIFIARNPVILLCIFLSACSTNNSDKIASRERISINEDWKFYKYDSQQEADSLIYDIRPGVYSFNDSKDADSKPTEAVKTKSKKKVLKPWILPTANSFIKNKEDKALRPEGNPGEDFPFVQNGFDDSAWMSLNLPHDWAISGPFYTGDNPQVGGGMGRLPSNGVAWYRKKIEFTSADLNKSVFLDFDGVMSYAMVWCNGNLVGGWPYGYNSWRVDLTPYVKKGENQVAVRVDNPNHSARWYPGGGIYRNVWLVKVNQVHVAHWGAFVATKNVSKEQAQIALKLKIDNNSEKTADVEVSTKIFELDSAGNQQEQVAGFDTKKLTIESNHSQEIEFSSVIRNPRLWGPYPTQKPNRYVAVTYISEAGIRIDEYETPFGIRSIEFNPDEGIIVNGEHIVLKGVNQHHDLGALGAAFNMRAAERQLEILRDMGCNSIRMAHNPPAPELLELTDKMGFLVIDEIFDSWEQKKTPHDFHLIFPEWSEPDTRAFIRRDRNHPSVIIWSYGNEVGEQYTGEKGAAVSQRLYNTVKEEDPTRPTLTAMNFAKPFMELPKIQDIIGLNYQGEGIRQDPMFEGTNRIRTVPQYDAFHEAFPEKVIISTETASSLSTRGTYLFPVTAKVSAPVRESNGGDGANAYVSAYELYAVDFGSSADKVFASLDQHAFVAGEFVWTGWDYIGEPTPYYSSRSSYSGIIDLAGFPKDRFYLYQARWRPDFPMVHILPHWNWPGREGKKTPVHVFTSGDEVELFLNGKSLGKKKKGNFEYRLRWDEVQYEPGELKAVAYKNGEKWAEETVKTTNAAYALQAQADRQEIKADGKDLSFITIKVNDQDGRLVRNAMNPIKFTIDGPGKIVATDNGDPTDMVAFTSYIRNAFNGLALVIVQSTGGNGTIKLGATSEGLKNAEINIQVK